MKSLFVSLFLISLSTLIAQQKAYENVSLDALMVETQFSSEDPDAMDMIWWIPFDFWAASFSQDPSVSAADIEVIEELFEGYELFAVIKGKIGYFGGVTYEPLPEIIEQFKVFYKDQPLLIKDPKEIEPDLMNFVAMIQPMMANMFGDMGKNMHFIFMRNNNVTPVLPIDPLSKDTLRIELGSFHREVDLPLSSLLKEKMCPVDKQRLSGKWSYCPFHGRELAGQK
ncbi:hypothetical protein [Altibacter sp.]|uniref:hypothetical protein n=1 Tax=Altibacter sp. TaxID=2024823 RepID=UPI000C92A42F|nr:hypothetical protein [Altibacter sp.]MAP53809.1 hypothetical protein [Altibacter sp.]